MGVSLTFLVSYFDPKKVEELKLKSKPSCPETHQFLQGILKMFFVKRKKYLFSFNLPYSELKFDQD